MKNLLVFLIILGFLAPLARRRRRLAEDSGC